MSNQLQENLDAILLDKNTNLKPENLKEGVTCLGVEGTLEEGIDTSDATATPRDIAMNKIAYTSSGKVTGTGFLGKNIYGALDYTSKTYTVEKIGSSSSSPYPRTYVFGKLALRHSYNTKIYIYYDGEYIGEYTCKLTWERQKRLGVVYYDDEQYIFIVNNEDTLTTNYEAISVNYITKTITDLGQISTIDETYFGPTDTTGKECIFAGNYLYRYQKDTNTFKKYNKFPGSFVYFTGNNFAIYKDISTEPGHVSKFTYDELSDTYNIISVQQDGVDGVSFYGNKIFMNGNVYTLNADLSVGELLAENVYTVNQSIDIYFLWINEKYVIYDIVLYYWDDTNNTFTEYIPMKYANLSGYVIASDNVTVTQYTFTNSEEIIGVNINGRDFYFNQGQINGTSDEVLFGKTVYTSGAEVIVGTMPNNGDVTIEPTVEQQTKSSGYYNSLQVNPVTSSIDANIKAENIKKDISILGVTGTLEGGTDTSDADATPNDIISPKTAYVNGEKIEGTIKLINMNEEDAQGFIQISLEHSIVSDENGFSLYNKTPVRQCYEQDSWIGVGIANDGFVNEIGLTADKLVEGNTVLGVVGTAIELKGQTKSVTPTINLQTIVPDENYNGLTSVEVTAVTSDIDSNIKPENIKSGVNILGVTGTCEGDNMNDYMAVPADMTTIEILDCIKKIPLIDTSAVTNMSHMFYGCTSLTTISQLDTSKVTSMNYMFQNCSALTTIPLLNTSKVTNMNNMFQDCTSLTTIPLLNTSKVTNMNYMFQNCSALTTIPLLNTSAVTSMRNMFSGCISLTTIPQLDTSKVTNMMNMFNSCTSLSNDSLNNILAMLTNATSYTGTKTLKYIGLSETQATTCTTLSNWSACETAGWTTGY